MAKYLDETGLGIVWAEIKKRLDGVADAAFLGKGSGLEYDSAETKIYLKDAAGNKLGDGIDAAPFIKDGMLEDVTTVVASVDSPIIYDGKGTGDNGAYVDGEKFIKFVWNTDGQEKVDYLLASEIGKVYTAGDGVSLEGDKISINEVDADKTKLSATITIAGGPLANNVIETGDEWPWEDEAGNKIIPQGKSVWEILTGLFLKVIEGTAVWGGISWSPSLAKPTATLSKDGTVEVGTTITATVAPNGTVSSNSRSATCTCSHGYFNSTDGSWNSGNKTVSVSGSVTKNEPAITWTWNGVATTEKSLKVSEEGDNILSVSQSGVSVSVPALSETTVYASTNTKSVLTDTAASKKQVAVLTDNSTEVDRARDLTSSNSDSVKGSYYYWVGTVAGTGLTLSSSIIRALNTKSGWVSSLAAAGTEVLTTVTVPSGGNTTIVAVPAGYTIKQILALGKDVRNEWAVVNGSGVYSDPKATVDVTLPDNSIKSYSIFFKENKGGADLEYTNLKLGK